MICKKAPNALDAREGMVCVGISWIVLNVHHLYGTLEETIRHAAFTVSTIITTTGYATTDFNPWPAFSKAIIMFLMVVGACAGSTGAGSTGGGLKVARLLLLKSLKRNIGQVLSSRRVQVVRNNSQVVNEKILDNTNAYLSAYVFIIIFSFVIISLMISPSAPTLQRCWPVSITSAPVWRPLTLPAISPLTAI